MGYLILLMTFIGMKIQGALLLFMKQFNGSHEGGSVNHHQYTAIRCLEHRLCAECLSHISCHGDTRVQGIRLKADLSVALNIDGGKG